jgi:uncharacterized membrane protein YfcA
LDFENNLAFFMLIFDLSLLLVILIVLVASTIRSAFGFGDALIAMPLLAFFMEMKTAVPLVAVSGFTISILILARHWKSAYVKGLWILILFCILGIPLGLLFLKNMDDKLIKIVLALLLIVFSSINLINPTYFILKSDKFAWIFGLFSGILGGAYNTNGPPIIIYGKMKRWEPEKFRAILQSVFLPTNLCIIIGQAGTGFWTESVVKYVVFCIPVIVIGTITGGFINKRMSKEGFAKYVDYILIVIGVMLLVNTLGK